MAPQPANTAIAVHRRIRAQRDDFLHTSVKHRASGVGFNDLIMSVPGEEIKVFEWRDTAFRTDAFRFGHPITVGERAKTTFEAAAEGITGLNFPVRFTAYPRDAFLEKSTANLTDDLHQEVRDISAPPRGLFISV